MNIDFELLTLKAGSAFSPAAPVDKKSLFAGRIVELARVIDAIHTKGQHAILFGERGVGKTSLANILHETLLATGFKSAIVNKVNCHSSDDFHSVWRKALKEIVYMAESQAIGFEPITKQLVMDLSQTTSDRIVPDEICKAFQRANSPIIFVFDEFDRIQDRQAPTLFADTMKMLSDNLIDGTLVLVGVADDVDDLIHGHESISRSVIQIKMPRMNEKELKEILAKGYKELEASIDEAASERIVKHCQGLPHYVHLLGLTSARSAFYRQSTAIMLEDVVQAIRRAIENAQHSVVSAYQTATSSTHPGHLYREVLLACALATKDELGYFTSADVRTPLGEIMGKKYEITAFGKHLNSFSLQERGSILTKTGGRKTYRYRFIDPLLPPYIIFRGVEDGLLTEQLIESLPVFEP